MRRIWYLIAGMTLLRAIAAAIWPLSTDEAYYWVWSRRLDWSYLDHPPMIAYIIRLTTTVSDSAFWLRLGPLAMGAATTYVVFLLGRDLFDERTGVTAAVLSQLAGLVGIMAVPDTPLFLAWVLTMRCVWQAAHDRPRRWLGAGAAAGAGLLSKLYMIFLIVGLGVFIVIYVRRWLLRWWPYGAALLAALIFSPVIYWNTTHEWAMLRFILYERSAGSPEGIAGLLRALEWQFAYVYFLFPPLLWAGWKAWMARRDERFGLLFWSTAPALAFPLAAVLVSDIPTPGWTAPAYIGVGLALAAFWNRRIVVLAAGNAAVLAYLFIVPFVPALPILTPGSSYGWEEIARRVAAERARFGGDTIVVADRYQLAASVAYYTRDISSVVELPRREGMVWQDPVELDAANAVTAMDTNWTPQIAWKSYFTRVEELPPFTISVGGRPVRSVRILRLYGSRWGEISAPPRSRPILNRGSLGVTRSGGR